MAFQVIYENEYGRVRFGGGNAPVYRTVEINGLGLPLQEFNVVSYVGEAGQTTQSVRDTARTITLNVDVIRPRQLQQELSKTIRVLYHPGNLKLQSGNRKRKIACRCSNMDDIVRKGRDMANITLQFICDNPYFTDYFPVSRPLFQRSNTWEKSFVLPAAFTQRLSQMNVVNNGDVKTEPLITIYCKDGGDSPAVQEGSGILLENLTTGQFIRLKYAPIAGEIITIDVASRTVSSSLGTNLITRLSTDTFLSDFWLDVGANEIKVTDDTDRDISVEIMYDNQYIEAVY